MLAFVLIIRVFEVTGSSVAVGLLMAVFTLPSLVLGIFAGVFVDRWSKRQVLLLTNVLQSLVILLFLGVGQKIWPIYTLIFMYSLVDEFFNPAEASLLPTLVPKKQLPTANSLFFLTVHSASIIGYSLGGPLIRFIGPKAPFLLGSLFLGLAALSVYFLPHDRAVNKNNHNGFEGVWEELKEGFMFIKNRKKILLPFLFYNSTQMVVVSAAVLFPQFSQEVLKIDLYDAGLFLIIPAGLGALTATTFLSRILPVFGRRLTILTALLGSGLSVLGLSLLVPNFAPPTYPAALILYFLGLCMVLLTAPVIAFLQESTPFDFRGRIFGGLSALVTWSVGLPVLLSATIADFFGTTRALTLIGLLVLALFFYLRREEFMNLSLRGD